MTYSILVEHQQPGSYTATVLGWSDCTAQGTTRQEALVRVRQALSERLANADVVSVEIESQSDHPWLKFGRW